MSKSTKIILAVLTAWPVVYMFTFMGFVIYFFVTVAIKNQPPEPNHFPSVFAVLGILHVLTILEIFGLMIFYLVHLFKYSIISQDKKIIWLLVLIFAGILSMPIYWYFYIWRKQPA